jgi:hypothetical protein
VVDWKESLPQIVAAIIGSSLLVTALSTINTYVFKPVIDISLDPHPSDTNIQNMSYTLSLKNIGYSPATHLRLTMSYPGAKVLGTTIDHEDENMTVKSERSTSSVVAFLPRLTPQASISIDTSITRNSAQSHNNDNTSFLPLVDYDSDIGTYVYSHDQPYSIVATYDQGSSEYSPPQSLSTSTVIYGVNTEILESLILIILAVLSFAIALRHKKRSKSKFASDILTDIIKVRNELNNNNHKSDPSGIILRFHAWQSNVDSERQIVSDYRDYQKIDDFYLAVRSRNCYLLQNHVSIDILNILNKDCVDKATIAYKEIDWRKFHKLDLILLIPAIILGSFFITYVEYIPAYISLALFSSSSLPTGEVKALGVLIIRFFSFLVFGFVLRGIISFFIVRLTLRATQGVIVNKFGLPSLFRSFAFLLFSFVIVGWPLGQLSFFFGSSRGVSYWIDISNILDIGTMLLLTWVVWRRYMKHKVKSRRHFFSKKRSAALKGGLSADDI